MTKKTALLLLWSLGFALFAVAFFYFMFGFKIWSAVAWSRLMRATLRGVAGLAFGAALLSCVPIYLAFVQYILKNGRLPFSKASKKPDSGGADEINLDAAPQYDFPENLPDELKEPFIRYYSGNLARNSIEFIQHRDTPASLMGSSVSDTSVPSVAEVSVPKVVDEPGAFMPVPSDFDAAPDESDGESDAAPVFHDVDFGAGENPVEFSKEDGKTVATCVFDDPDFWVADDSENWFAAGKQIKSPIKILLEADADKRVLVLKSKNIMNLDATIKEWEKAGIKVLIE